MTDTTALITLDRDDGNPYALMPVYDIAAAAARRDAVINYTRRMMVSGTDYGRIPGTGDKPTLLKPGAEKLASLFGLSPRFEIIDRDMDWTGERHNGEAFFYVQYRCTLTRGDLVAGQGVGSCNSWEKKYRYRTIYPDRATAEEKTAGRLETRGGRRGSYQVYVLKNPDPADVVNTIDKMAQKRALVAAVLIAVNASELFTQDVEDHSDIIDGDWQPDPPAARATTTMTSSSATTAPPPPRQGKQPAPKSDNGPLPDDELAVNEAPGREFVTTAAALLGIDADAVKERLRALGYTGVPGKSAERLAAYRRLKADRAETRAEGLQGDLFGETEPAAAQDVPLFAEDPDATQAALETATGELD